MKICRFKYDEQIYFGVIEDESIYPLENFQTLNGPLINNRHKQAVKLQEVLLLPPVAPSKIVCVGRNYADHAKELGNEIPREPLLFLKAPSSIIIDGEDILLPLQSNQVEHEGELGVVISSDCKDLSENDNPLEYVFGYICLNDVTARDLQKRDGQFARAKSFDSFCPINSFIETDLNVTNIKVTTKINGIIKQEGRTSQMVFPIPFLIRYISNQMTLKAGDVIATGTPSGVSRLNDGDVCEVEIEGIGKLRNPVKQK
jgi:2-keto-4-pentenoate hydratase/2-oxohepta-3-ene-1,7-dioic acid hydratase in catechol pathway